MRTITARPFWKKPASSMSALASACSSWSTACKRKPTPRPGRRVRRSRRHHGHARRSARRRCRLDPVRLALCRPQHPAADQQSAALDAGVVERRPRIGDLSDPASRTRSASMANSLQVFRESMIQSRALSAEQDKDRVAKAERAARMEARIVEFETTVRTALDSLSTPRVRCSRPRRPCRRPPTNPARW